MSKKGVAKQSNWLRDRGLVAFMAFFMGCNEAGWATYAILIHGWTVYFLSVISFLVLSTYFYHQDIRLSWEMFKCRVARLKKATRAKKILVIIIFFISLGLGGVYAGFSYMNSMVFIYNTMMSALSTTTVSAMSIAHSFAIPASIILFGLFSCELSNIFLYMIDHYDCLWEKIIDVGSSGEEEKNNNSQYIMGLDARQWPRQTIKLLFLASAVLCSCLIGSVLTKFLLYGYQRFSVVIMHQTLAPDISPVWHYFLLILISIMLTRSFFSCIELFFNSDEFDKLQKPKDALGWIKLSICIFFSCIRVIVQAITTKTFVKTASGGYGSQLSGGFAEALRVLEYGGGSLAVKSQINDEHDLYKKKMIL